MTEIAYIPIEKETTGWVADFRRLWSALTIALFGTQIAALALPLAAAVALGASPLQMGLLAAAGPVSVADTSSGARPVDGASAGRSRA